jgi:hypothetical protein
MITWLVCVFAVSPLNPGGVKQATPYHFNSYELARILYEPDSRYILRICNREFHRDDADLGWVERRESGNVL